jgi:hypothetical protein
MKFADRYQALGVPHPSTDTICQDQCEGTGWLPISKDNMEEPWRSLWLEAEAKEKSDRWHFVKCPTCHDTGRRS